MRLLSRVLSVLDSVREGAGFIRWVLLRPAPEPAQQFRRDSKLSYLALLQDHNLAPSAESGIGPGWVSLVDILVQDLKRMGWDGQVDHIKVKKGMLRFYIPARSITPTIKARIALAERTSLSRCEYCGDSGKTTSLSPELTATLCAECAAYLAQHTTSSASSVRPRE